MGAFRVHLPLRLEFLKKSFLCKSLEAIQIIKMYKSLILIACTSAIVSAVDPITLGIGSSTYILSGTAAAITSLGILAFAKSLLPAFGNLVPRIGKRDTANAVSSLDMDPLFDAISSVDVADCGKLLVCHIVAKPEAFLTAEESNVANLFRSLGGKIDPLHSKAQYMLAAQIGSYKKTSLCVQQYLKCPYPADQLSSLLKKQ